MAENAEETKPNGADETAKSSEAGSPAVDPSASATPQPPSAAGLPAVSLSIWPPSRRTRDAVIKHLIENLSTPSVISSRYGVISAEDASAAANRIEVEAFDAAAGGDRGNDSIDVGFEVLHVYSGEISRRVMEFVKARGSSAAADDKGVAPASESAAPAGAGEEGSPVES